GRAGVAATPAAPTASAPAPAPPPPRANASANPSASEAPSAPDIWKSLLAALDTDARTLADILRARGKLESCANGRAIVRLAGLKDDERAIVAESRNARAVSAALTKVCGRAVEAQLLTSEVVAAAK